MSSPWASTTTLITRMHSRWDLVKSVLTESHQVRHGAGSANKVKRDIKFTAHLVMPLCVGTTSLITRMHSKWDLVKSVLTESPEKFGNK